MTTGYELIEKMYSENYDEYEDTRLYSTGDSELDDLLERAFCEGYEYAQREYAKRDYEGLSPKAQSELREARSVIAKALNAQRKQNNLNRGVVKGVVDVYDKFGKNASKAASTIVPEKKKDIKRFAKDWRSALEDVSDNADTVRNISHTKALEGSKKAAEAARKVIAGKDKVRGVLRRAASVF